MKVDINNALTIIIGIITIVGAIYKLAQIENRLLLEIEQLQDRLVNRFYEVEKRLDVHLTEYNEKKQFLEYRMNDVDKRIEHKFNRLANWVKQIAGFLNKESNFQIRDDQF